VKRPLSTSDCGFTLLELLIAVIIFSLIAAMAYSGLNNVLNARSKTEARVQQLYQLQMALTLMERDVEQTVDRPVRDQYGDEKPALVGNEYGDFLLEFTHTGWLNPLSAPRSNLQRVAYWVKDEKLYRTIWYVLDRAQDSKHYDTVLLDGVKNLEFKYLDNKNEWQRSWPPQNLSGSTQAPLLQQAQQQTQPGQPQAALQFIQQPTFPRGIMVDIDTKSFGKVERWFHVLG
jgi:general secretion pathway protein J